MEELPAIADGCAEGRPRTLTGNSIVMDNHLIAPPKSRAALRLAMPW